MHYSIPRLRTASTILAALFTPVLAHATPDSDVLKRFPHASAEQVVFVARGDLWRAPRLGGAAVRLTTTNMRPIMPRFSPDGQYIAFSAKSDGHQDVYVMPAAGGAPQRITFHANRGRNEDDMVVAWAPDSKAVVFGSTIGAVNSKDYRLFSVPITGGLPQPLPMEHAGLMSYVQDARHVVYASSLNDFDNRKRYNGGQAAELVSIDLSTLTSKQLTHWKGNDTAPMWFDGKIYFVSDRDPHRRANLWLLDPATGKTRQLTFFTDYDVDFPSLGGNQLTFQQNGKLYAMDLPSTRLREIKVTLPPAELVKIVDMAGFIRESDGNNAPAFALAPDGSAAMLSARGDLFHVATSGDVRLNLTATSGADEEHPAYSPDGATIAYITDIDGEQQLALRPARGGPERIVTHFKQGFLFAPVWAPDGKSVAVADADKRLWHITLANGAARIIAQDKHQRIDDAAFSPDSRYLAFSIANDNQQRSIHLYDLDRMQDHVASSPMNNDRSPVFAGDGRSLYFISSRHEFPVTSSSEEAFVTVNAQGIYVTTLQAANATAPDEIDFDGMPARTLPLSIAPGTYSSLTVSNTQLYYQSHPQSMIGGDLPGQEQSLHVYDLRTGKDRRLLSGFDTAVVSANGATLLYKQGKEWKFGSTAAGAPAAALTLSGMTAKVDLRQEWAAMFHRTWRLDRDFYLSATMNGIDWPAVRRAYAKFLPLLGSRDDLSYLIGQLQGELATSHMIVGGGDTGPHGDRPAAPRLGADYAFDSLSGHYRFAHIYPGDNSRPALRSPLTAPGVDVRAGDYLLEINGKPLKSPQTPDSVMEGQTGPIELTVARRLQEAPRHVSVVPIANEFALREAAMIEQNRRKVERLSNGRLGYLYMADFHQRGAEQFVRQFYPQMDKQGLIIDIRGNAGGFTSQQILARLSRHVAGLYVNRQGGRETLPAQLIQGPMITLTNGFTSSDGDQFAYYFRQSGLGKVVGTRTWGGVRGVTSPLDLMDGGYVLVPKDVLYSPDGKWIIDNVGAEPDVEVLPVAGESLHGGDKQLETAVDMLNRALDRHPTVLPPAPPAVPSYPAKGQVPGPSF
jgi:tricorn protease